MTENQKKLKAAKRELENTNRLLGCALGEGVMSSEVSHDILSQIFFNRDVIVFIEKGKVG